MLLICGFLFEDPPGTVKLFDQFKCVNLRFIWGLLLSSINYEEFGSHGADDRCGSALSAT